MYAPETRARSRSGTSAAQIAPAADVEQHHPEARAELGEEEQREHERLRSAGERDEHERRGEEHAAEREARPDADPPRDPAGDDRADEAADRAGAEHEPERARLRRQLAVAKSTKSAKKTKLKKLIVAVASSAARTIGEPAMKRSPATSGRAPPRRSAAPAAWIRAEREPPSRGT